MAGKSGKVKKKTVTTIIKEGEEPEAEKPQEAPGEKEETKEPRISALEILTGQAESEPETFQDWKMQIHRIAPLSLGETALKQGRIREIAGLVPYAEIEEIIRQEHGGGRYSVIVRDNITTRHRKWITIEEPAKVTLGDKRFHEEKYGKSPPQERGKEETDDEAAGYKQKKKALEAKMELERIKADYDKLLEKLNPDDEEPEDMEPGIPGAVYGQPFGLQDPQKMREEITRDLRREFETRDTLRAMEAKIETLQRELANRAAPPPQDNSTKEFLKLLAEKFNPIETVSQIIKLARPNTPPQDNTALAEQFKTANAIVMTSIQEAIKTSGEITREAMRNALAPGSERTWPLELIDKGTEAIKELGSGLIEFNKSKQELARKQLELVGEGKLRPAPLPQPRPVPRPPAPQPRPAAPLRVAPPPVQPPAMDANMAQVMAGAQALMEEAVPAFLGGQSPVFFARKTLELAGQDVTMFLMENQGLQTIREIIFQYCQETGDMKQFNDLEQYVTNNPPARAWVEQWLAAIKNNYRPAGEPAPQTVSPMGAAPPPMAEMPQEAFYEEGLHEIPEPDFEMPDIDKVPLPEFPAAEKIPEKTPPASEIEAASEAKEIKEGESPQPLEVAEVEEKAPPPEPGGAQAPEAGKKEMSAE